jgi:hypothetical protein
MWFSGAIGHVFADEPDKMLHHTASSHTHHSRTKKKEEDTTSSSGKSNNKGATEAKASERAKQQQSQQHFLAPPQPSDAELQQPPNRSRAVNRAMYAWRGAEHPDRAGVTRADVTAFRVLRAACRIVNGRDWQPSAGVDRAAKNWWSGKAPFMVPSLDVSFDGETGAGDKMDETDGTAGTDATASAGVGLPPVAGVIRSEAAASKAAFASYARLRALAATRDALVVGVFALG